jgi:predicted permease
MALSTAVGIVLAASTLTALALYAPLRRALATAVSTLALFAIGLRLSMVGPPSKFDLPPPVR